MGTTEVQAAAEAEGLEITELEKFEVTRVDGVANPANGFPVLLMKALPRGRARLERPTEDGFQGTYGGVPAPGPDADDGAGCGCCPACQCPPPSAAKAAGVPEGIAKQAEAAAQEILKAYASIDGDWSYTDGALVKRMFTAQQRRDLAARGQALADGSYPIENAEDLGNAASLARSKHGNWKGAMRLIAKMARKLGVPNPLKKKNKGAAKGVTVAEGAAAVDTETGNGTPEGAGDAVTKATEPLLKDIADLRAANEVLAERLAKVEALPQPGGPVLSVHRPGTDGAAARKAGLIAKAEEQERLARTMTDPVMADRAGKAAAQYRSDAERLD